MKKISVRLLVCGVLAIGFSAAKASDPESVAIERAIAFNTSTLLNLEKMERLSQVQLDQEIEEYKSLPSSSISKWLAEVQLSSSFQQTEDFLNKTARLKQRLPLDGASFLFFQDPKNPKANLVLPLAKAQNPGPILYAARKLKEKNSPNLKCVESKEFLSCTYVETSRGLVNDLIEIFKNASKKGSLGEKGQGGKAGKAGKAAPSGKTTETAVVAASILSKRPNLSGLSKCAEFDQLKELDGLVVALANYRKNAHGKPWTEYASFDLSLSMGSKRPISDAAAQKLIRAEGLGCSNTESLLKCRFGIASSSSGMRYGAVDRAIDIVLGELVAATAATAQKCGKASTVAPDAGKTDKSNTGTTGTGTSKKSD